jgi:hypothetical protein
MQWTTAMIRYSGACLTVTFTVLLAGCQLFVNPWRDEIAHNPPVTTGSAEYADALDVAPVVRHRDVEQATVRVASGTVTHGALYFEDPCETAGSDDGQFAWTKEDLAYSALGPIRYMLNLAFIPVSVVEMPPWTVMASDGETSRHVLWMPHDAGRETNAATNLSTIEGS